MAVLLPTLKQKYFAANGTVLAGGKIYSYIAGTSTPLATYTDAGGGTPNANPVTLDSNGEANIWISNASYKFVVKDSLLNTIYTVDNVTPNFVNFVGDSGSGGVAGLVPAPSAGDAAASKFLKADGTWTTVSASGSGGGGGSLQWVEDALAPISSTENNAQVYLFQNGLTQYLYADVRVPTSYVTGSQINLKLTYYSPDIVNTVLFTTLSTLVRPSVEAITATTNQRTSTNGAVTLSGVANMLRTATIDLTSSTGTINAVAVGAGNLIRVRLTRGSDTATSDVRALIYGAEVTFS